MGGWEALAMQLDRELLNGYHLTFRRTVLSSDMCLLASCSFSARRFCESGT